MELADEAWSETLLSRDDARWRRDLDFLAVAASVLHRRRLVRRVRGLISAPFFAQWGEELLAADADALRATMRVLDAKQSVRSTLASADVPACVKRALKCVRLAESSVPGTDGYKDTMRCMVDGLRAGRGQPVLFLTARA